MSFPIFYASQLEEECWNYYQLLRLCHDYVITVLSPTFLSYLSHMFAYELSRSNGIYLCITAFCFSSQHLSALVSPYTLISTEIVESLASVGLILSLIRLEKVVGENWPWFRKYGDVLLEVFKKMTIPPLQTKPKQPRGQKKALDEWDRDDERTTKRSCTDTSHTSSSKKPAQIQDPSTGPVTHLPPAMPLPHNPYTHLLTPGSFPYLNYQPQPNYQYYYNTTPQFSVSDQHVNICQHTIINNIASSSRTNFPPLNSQFRAYNPQNLK